MQTSRTNKTQNTEKPSGVTPLQYANHERSHRLSELAV